MNEITSSNPLLRSLKLEDLRNYLEYSGWQSVDSSPVGSWIVFEGPNDTSGRPLEIVLSRNIGSVRFFEYLASCVNLLAALNNEPFDIIIQKIQNVDRDVLNIRNVNSTSDISVPLRQAATQVSRLRSLIKHASNSERDALPYYRSDYRNTLADTMTNLFQFGHTQRRSFGYSVLSPMLRMPEKYKQLRLNLESDEQENMLDPLAPIERRIMERVIRGLVATKQAVQRQSVDDLVKSYSIGFNANMAGAIIDIAPTESTTVEYSVIWSPRISPPEDISEVTSIALNLTDYHFLKAAAKEMRQLEVQDTVNVRGRVLGLSTTDDPHKLDSGQSIIVNWNRPDTGHTVKLIVELSPKEYILAVDAHREWSPIIVTGEAKLVGNRWRLFNPRDFAIATG